ncbi:GRAM domain-containing protein [Lentibacillus saliphilus]|uniref:GRAM domain-containing protein n=1 Tax=Lentibacillus saliphilus TaxID=2737028 RepID=UPI001C30E245|nr:GRAM domain-containing protein [Lentibacillus saliphilus]
MEWNKGEQEHLKTGANLKRGLEMVGGRLYVTNERLYFKPHSINIQKDDLDILLDQIRMIEKSKSMGFISNAMTVTTAEGIAHKFVVAKRDKVIDCIQSVKA